MHTCKKTIPVYPVRYAVKGVKQEANTTYADKPGGEKLDKSFPALDTATYTLRTIPKDYFILIVEEFKGIPDFRVFQNSHARKGFIEIDWEKYDEDYTANKSIARPVLSKQC